MIHQPPHLVLGLTDGALSLVALGFCAARVRAWSRNARQRGCRWLLLLLGVGLALRAADEWRLATEWPVVRVWHHYAPYYIGMAFQAAAALGLMWVPLKGDGVSDSPVAQGRG